MTNLAFPPIPTHFNTDHIANEITMLAGQINAATHRLLKLIGRFDQCKGWSGGGTVRSCAHWLNWKCGIDLGAAREKVRVANCLESLPQIDAAFASGEISYSKVRAMTRVATPENEDYLLQIAQYGTASHVEKVVGKYKQVTRKDDAVEELEQEAARKLVYFRDEDGMWVVHAKLPAEAGALLVKAIEAIVAPTQAEKQTQIREQRQAQSQDNLSAETREPPFEAQESCQFQELLEHTRADALIAISEHFLATCKRNEGLAALKGSERCQVMLHVDIETLRRQQHATDCEHSHCNLDDKHWIAPHTARRLSCDATLVTVLEDKDGNVLNIGRRSRTVPPALNRALKIRDKTCRFPGCCESRYVDVHHIQHWADGGETSLDNLMVLCRYHHRQLHRGAFSVSAESSPSGRQLIFKNSAGHTLETNLAPQFPGVSAETSSAALRTMAPNVNAKTAVTRWTGENCDYGMAIDALLRRDQPGFRALSPP
ncbi:HNH endonuclease signature motif containing protein [Kineobactrum salinum]|uniref:DUF222 domain-containing protein n=1 Tax=Kineobactrum salinum TaxID=2708301 RepID=A0A6C0U3G6_9GAMM|nr:HNH endonuclease signature motif containing protein [Kineobactrum salinum]QIB66710.1 DUF222 domain-containing protein [Kineobactrum salinum]